MHFFGWWEHALLLKCSHREALLQSGQLAVDFPPLLAALLLPVKPSSGTQDLTELGLSSTPLVSTMQEHTPAAKSKGEGKEEKGRGKKDNGGEATEQGKRRE